MKHSHFNVQIIIALLAIGLTVFTSAKPVKRVTAANCYRNVTATCPTPVSLQFNVTDCELSQLQQGKGVIGGNSFIGSLNCGEVQSVFCCAQLRKVAGPLCAGHAPLVSFIDAEGNVHVNSYAEISAVFCRPAAF